MLSKRNTYLVVAVLALVGIGYYVYGNNTGAPATTKTLTFIMAHKPDNTDNVALLQGFADTVNQRTQGAVTIRLVDPNYSTADYSSPKTAYTLGLAEVDSGAADMSQVAVTSYSELYPELYPLDTLNAPGVFSSHEQATRVLDGVVGDALKGVVDTGSGGKLHALSFTYSGGYRNLFTTKPVISLSDLTGLRTSSVQYLSRDFLQSLGAVVQSDIPEQSNAWEEGIANDSIQLIEAEMIRVESYRSRSPVAFNKIKTVIQSEHNLFLTLMVINGASFASLASEEQSILAEEAQSLALKERKLSIDQEVAARTGFVRDGITVITPTSAEKEVLSAASALVRAKNAVKLGEWFKRISEER